MCLLHISHQLQQNSNFCKRIAGVREDNITGVTAQPEENQNNSEDNLHSEPGAPELQRTGHVVPNDAQITPDKNDRPDTYNSKPLHKREAHLIAETPAVSKKVTIPQWMDNGMVFCISTVH